MKHSPLCVWLIKVCAVSRHCLAAHHSPTEARVQEKVDSSVPEENLWL